MNESYDFRDIEFLTVGALGPKGQREFFLQARSEGRLLSLKIEKQQVAALAEYLDRVLAQLPEGEAGPTPENLDLREPVIAAWTVGSIGIAYAEEIDRLIVMAEAVSETDDTDTDADAETDVAHARFTLSREQVAALVERARMLVAAGRPPCAFCGQPLDPRNHDWCPCHN